MNDDEAEYEWAFDSGFQKDECRCANCSSGGAWEYKYGGLPDDCLFKRR